MDWLSNNWLILALLAGCVAMHFFGHGRRGAHGGHGAGGHGCCGGAEEQDRADPKAKDPAREARREAVPRAGRASTAAFIVIAVLSVGAAGYLVMRAFSPPRPAPMAGNVIDISADMGGFSRKVVRVKAGEPVTVRLTSLDNSMHSDGGGKHQWAVDALGVNIIAPPQGSSYRTFTPDRPGTYVFYCDICCGGRANPNMSGELVVVG